MADDVLCSRQGVQIGRGWGLGGGGGGASPPRQAVIPHCRPSAPTLRPSLGVGWGSISYGWHIIRMPLSDAPDAVLLLGALTSPHHGGVLREQVRRLVLRPSSDVDVRFVLGQDCLVKHAEALRNEPDIVGVNTSECSLPPAERKQQLSSKVHAWFMYAATAATTRHYRWVGKTDDDTLVDLGKLRHDLMMASAVLPPEAPYGYYGTMRWRWFRTDRWKPCGPFTEVGPPSPVPQELGRKPAGCSSGPFPYCDGSLYVLSAPLARRVWGGSGLDVASGLPSITRQLVGSAPGWSEDVRAGFAVYAESLAQAIPVTWLALSKWVHMRFWLDADDPAQRDTIDGRVVWVHRMKHPADANHTHARMRETGHVPGGGFQCAKSCRRWWRSPPEAVTSSSTPSSRRAPPSDALGSLRLPPAQSRCCHRVS